MGFCISFLMYRKSLNFFINCSLSRHPSKITGWTVAFYIIRCIMQQRVFYWPLFKPHGPKVLRQAWEACAGRWLPRLLSKPVGPPKASRLPWTPCNTVAHSPRITAARKSRRNSFKRSSVLLQLFMSGSFYKLWIGFTDLTKRVTSAGSKFQIKNTELPVHA